MAARARVTLSAVEDALRDLKWAAYEHGLARRFGKVEDARTRLKALAVDSAYRKALSAARRYKAAGRAQASRRDLPSAYDLSARPAQPAGRARGPYDVTGGRRR